MRINYFNNLVEQDHRLIKRRLRPMLGFKNFQSAASAITGLRPADLIRQGQFSLFQRFCQIAARRL